MLRFIDIRDFIAGGTLDQFTRDFGKSSERVKSFFPYQSVTWDNFKDCLMKSEPFPKEAFYSDLTKETVMKITVLISRMIRSSRHGLTTSFITVRRTLAL